MNFLKANAIIPEWVLVILYNRGGELCPNYYGNHRRSKLKKPICTVS